LGVSKPIMATFTQLLASINTTPSAGPEPTRAESIFELSSLIYYYILALLSPYKIT
jgi:hypothetical protein